MVGILFVADTGDHLDLVVLDDGDTDQSIELGVALRQAALVVGCSVVVDDHRTAFAEGIRPDAGA